MRNIRALFISFIIILGGYSTSAQETFPTNGVTAKDVNQYAIAGATVHVDPQTIIEGATIIVKGRKIIEIGVDIPIPQGTVVIDATDKHIYPSFIDPYSDYGMSEVKRPKWEPKPQYESKKEGPFAWNQSIHPETDSFDEFSVNSKKAKELRSAGFGLVLTHRPDGIMRGTGLIVGLGEDLHDHLVMPKASAHYSFSKGSSRQSNPSSLMGGIALLRQTYYDAEWYSSDQNTSEVNVSLQALNDLVDLPQFFECREKFDVLRADKIGDEFDIQYIFKGSGEEYQRIEDMKETGGKFILPLDFPLPYDVSDPFLSRMVSVAEMKHWEMAPTNAAAFENAGIEFAFTSRGLKSPSKLIAQVKKAIEYGLSPEMALEALTISPAIMIGLENEYGTLEKGKMANFIISSGEIFGDSKIHENWVHGDRFVIKSWDDWDISGIYNLNFDDRSLEVDVKDEGKPSGKIQIIAPNAESGKLDTTEVKVQIMREGQLLTLNMELPEPNEGITRLTGNINSQSRIWDGKGQLPGGQWVDWVAVRQAAENESEAQEGSASDSLKVKEVGDIIYPFMAYGDTILPESKTILIRNATIWTCDESGKIDKGQILIHDGKIAAVGENISMNDVFGKTIPEYEQIDARDKHVTPGIIDEHSHIAIRRGVNEGTQASSAEVRIGDALESEDIDIYRQLAGGVTCSQLLHGSANPIGGQSALVKLRWGKTPEEMKVEAADGFIKFALGENVKQSNWGQFQTIRFPQSRMGVEQVYYDHFIRAREYGEQWKAYDKVMSSVSRKQLKRGDFPDAPRVDLELEALLEILNSERFVTCHSYMQHEINMLMHVADSMGFTLNTFTHILEGYKLADKMKEHGAGGSSFSDWWAYKYEVKDAIPHNGALMWEQGVTVAYNSDDAEMARRLNQEAAKAVKYGGVPEEEALKFVTLNPAKLLHVDDRMGSLTVGKDADIVIWTDHPLSIYAQADRTYVDGICYYSQERDEQLKSSMEVERARLIQKMLGAKEKGETTQKPQPKNKRHYHCDTLGDECH